MNLLPDGLPAPVDDIGFLPDRPSLLLSASIPVHRDPALFEPADRQRVAEVNRLYVASASPERIRAATIAVTRVALLRGLRLVFGAHPTISPLVLQVAEDVDAVDDSILVFQSDAYRDQLPGSTLQFANWSRGTRSHGQLVLTTRQHDASTVPAAQPTPSGPRLLRYDPFPISLRFMRDRMTTVPGLVGAVFIGGMPGVEDEASRFAQRHPQLRRYAFDSTGGAAQRLVQQQPLSFYGSLRNPAAFRRTPSYTVAASLMLDDLVPPGGRP